MGASQNAWVIAQCILNHATKEHHPHIFYIFLKGFCSLSEILGRIRQNEI